MDRQVINSYIIEHNLKNVKDNNSIIELLIKQNDICSIILDELNTNKKKKKHWAWYVFPTDKPGISDPLQTYVTKDTAKMLLKFAPNEWQLCLEKIIELAIEKNYILEEKVLPFVDIGRVIFFTKFWKTISNKPDWLNNVCDILEILINNNIDINKKKEEINKIKKSTDNIKLLKRLIKKHFNKLENLKKLI